jgi:hypothetical protein
MQIRMHIFLTPPQCEWSVGNSANSGLLGEKDLCFALVRHS